MKSAKHQQEINIVQQAMVMTNMHSIKAFNDRRVEKLALKSANGPSKAPRGYKPDTETRTKLQNKVEGKLNYKGTTFYEGTYGDSNYKVLEPKSIRKGAYDNAANTQDWEENPGTTVPKMEVDMITGRKGK